MRRDAGRVRDAVELNRRKLRHGAAAGVVATMLMTALMAAAPSLAGAWLPERVERALATARARPLLTLVALAVHLGYGALAGALYAVGARRVTVGSGLWFGLGLWGVAAVVYAPLFGLGFVGAHAPALGPLLLPAHLLYGGALGALGPPPGEILQPAPLTGPLRRG